MGRGIQRPAKDDTPAVDVPSLVFITAPAPLLRDASNANLPVGNGEMV